LTMTVKKRKGLYPGTFDPVTNGHIDLMRRALEIFDEVVVAVAHQSHDKGPLFSIPERVRLLEMAIKPFGKRITVDEFDGLLVNYARRIGAVAMIRGLRVISDFEYEFQMALTNRKLAPDMETIFLMPQESCTYISSRSIKEVASLGGDVSAFVPPYVRDAIKIKYGR
jgi:pantetheine-phosphate adenylyltransferase